MDVTCRASSSGTVTVGTSASGRSLIGAAEGVTLSSWYPVRAPLSQRLSELEDAGIVIADREPGRREVWYRLTEAGADLGPVIGMLNWWGLRHAWRWPQAGEPLHGEHLLRSAIQAIDLAADDHEPARWHFRLDGTDYLAESNGAQWSVTTSPPPAPADVTITATTQSLAALIFTGSDAGIDITGETGAAERFRHLIGTMAAVVQPA
jgi:hypothetical protein